MCLKPIKTNANHEAAQSEIERLWAVKDGTPEGKQLDILLTLVEAFEEANFHIDMPDPIEAINFRLEQQGQDREHETEESFP
jgi:HTH-type transcriptional regulator/antitoxin HigA